MPKTTNTKAQKARELLQRLERGPSLHFFTIEPPTQEQVEREYRIWMDTWIIPAVKELVPQLKERQSESKSPDLD